MILLLCGYVYRYVTPPSLLIIARSLHLLFTLVPISSYGVLCDFIPLYSRGLSGALTTSLQQNHTVPPLGRRWIGVVLTLNTGFEHCTLGDLIGPILVSSGSLYESDGLSCFISYDFLFGFGLFFFFLAGHVGQRD